MMRTQAMPMPMPPTSRACPEQTQQKSSKLVQRKKIAANFSSTPTLHKALHFIVAVLTKKRRKSLNSINKKDALKVVSKQSASHIMPGVLHIVRIGDAGLHAGLIAQISTAASRNTSLGRVLVLLVVALVDGVAQLAVLGDAAAAKLKAERRNRSIEG